MVEFVSLEHRAEESESEAYDRFQQEIQHSKAFQEHIRKEHHGEEVELARIHQEDQSNRPLALREAKEGRKVTKFGCSCGHAAFSVDMRTGEILQGDASRGDGDAYASRPSSGGYASSSGESSEPQYTPGKKETRPY